MAEKVDHMYVYKIERMHKRALEAMSWMKANEEHLSLEVLLEWRKVLDEMHLEQDPREAAGRPRGGRTAPIPRVVPSNARRGRTGMSETR